MQFDNSNTGGSEQASTLEEGQFLLALRKIMKREVEVLVIRTVEQMIVPIVGDLVKKVVKEEIQSVEKRLLARKPDEVTALKERCLELKLSDDVSNPVLTGKPLNGEEGNPLKVELVDMATGRVVEKEPISSAKVEILVLDASRDDNQHEWTQESFNNRIIRKGDKKRPHFSKDIYIDLKDGVGFLSNVKLGHNSSWMKGFKCRLGARIVDSFRGVHVREGRTDSFMVVDCRSKLYEKHYPPSLSDEVWRLDNIGKDGARHKRLNEENIGTVGDFRFLLSVDPHRLQELVSAGAKWNATVDHALTCPKDHKVYLHYPSTSTDSKMGVVFDAVGELKGIINDSHFVPINNLPADEKDIAEKLLLSAFKNRDERICFDDEASLLNQFPSGVNGITNYSIQEGPNACTTMLDIANNNDHVGFLASTNMGQVYSPISDFPTPFQSYPFSDPGTSFHCNNTAFENPNDMFDELYSGDFDVEPAFTDNLSSMSLFSNNLSEVRPPSRRYVLVFPVAKAKVWVLRAKERVKSLGGVHACKKQKT